MGKAKGLVVGYDLGYRVGEVMGWLGGFGLGFVYWMK